ncbi:MAG: aldehyde dehydrogenase [Acidobacteria bacterium]|nr:MAG: aldehyde dehydrogenase [Acidobacteriota bacterium]PYR10683.1 MAG: aldehyde dehydrogenase [Acidobacteriota bacterium]
MTTAEAVRRTTEEEKATADDLLRRARAAMKVAARYDQERVDRLCRAVAWATANEQTFGRLTRMSVDESGMGSAEGVPARRWKILGILRDALRTRTVGVIEEVPEKGIVKYAKPVGVIAGVLPVTNPLVTMVNMAINALKCRDAVIFSPHPLSRNTALEITRVLRAALGRQGAPEDLVLCLPKPSIPLAQELMAICDLTIATGGAAMVKAAYSSGKPAYGVGAGNATVIVDETADIADAARNTRISKTQNHGSGCSCDGNLLVQASVYERFVAALQAEGGYLASEAEKQQLASVMWEADGRRTLDTIARPARTIAARAGFDLPEGKTFIIVKEAHIGEAHRFSSEKLAPVLAVFKYDTFDDLLQMVTDIFEVGGKGHSLGIASFNHDHIHRLAMMAPVSRMMVRQPNVSGNAGSFTNGMPMTASLGCGTWGGNVTSENISVKHYMNTTWVSVPIAEDKPTEQELLGDLYNSEIF